MRGLGGLRLAAAPEVVLAAAEVADDAQRPALLVDSHDGVVANRLAGPAQVRDGAAWAVRPVERAHGKSVAQPRAREVTIRTSAISVVWFSQKCGE